MSKTLSLPTTTTTYVPEFYDVGDAYFKLCLLLRDLKVLSLQEMIDSIGIRCFMRVHSLVGRYGSRREP